MHVRLPLRLVGDGKRWGIWENTASSFGRTAYVERWLEYVVGSEPKL